MFHETYKPHSQSFSRRATFSFPKDQLMTTRNERWLFAVFTNSSYRFQLYLLLQSKKKSGTQYLLYTGNSSGFFSSIVTDSKKYGFEALWLDELLQNFEADGCNKTNQNNFFERLFPFFNIRILLFTFLTLISTSLTLRLSYRKPWAKRLLFCKKLIQNLKLDLVICNEDGISADLALISSVRYLSVPLFNVPFGSGAQHEIEIGLDAKLEARELLIAKGFEKVMLKLFAQNWLKKGKHSDAIIFPYHLIFALESLGITVKNPWIIHGGFSDVLCVEHAISWSRYIDEKIDNKKLKLTGSPYCDILHDAKKGASKGTLIGKTGKKKEVSIELLVSWPPDYHATHGDKNDFSSYEDMTKKVLTGLSNLKNFHVTVSAHPGCTKRTLKLINETGCSVTNEYIVQLIPECDIFLAFGSSAFQWSLAAGKVTIHYDMYQFNMAAYPNNPGYLEFSTFKGIKEQLLIFSNEPNHLFQLKGKQKEAAQIWGNLDGKNCERIFREIEAWCI